MLGRIQQEKRMPTRDEQLAASKARNEARIAAQSPMERKWVQYNRPHFNSEKEKQSALLLDILITLDKIRERLG